MNPNRRFHGRVRGAFLAMLFTMIAAGDAVAQPWEYTYGPSSGWEDSGTQGLTQVSACGTGYITVGRSSASGNWDIYVARTGTNGAAIWEATFDIANPAGVGLGGDDGASSVKEIPGGGFIIAGSTDLNSPGGVKSIVLMKLNCNGALQWTKVFGDNTNDFVARDVIVAANGDFVLCGWMRDAAINSRDGYLLRTDPNGTPIWQSGCESWSPEWNWPTDDVFESLIEATPNTPTGYPTQTTGDIVAVGSTTMPLRARDALVVRLDGTNGWPTNPNHGVTNYSSRGDDGFMCVRELQGPGAAGNLIYSGYTTTFAGGSSDIYLASSTLQPWVPGIRKRVGDFTQGVSEFGTGIIEVPVNTSFSAAGDFVLTGTAYNWSQNTPQGVVNASDAFLIHVDPLFAVTTGPGAASPAFYFGDHAGRDDGGYALLFDQDLPLGRRPGFVFSGYTRSNLDLNNPPDPLDLYLVKANQMGQTGCHMAFTPSDMLPTDSIFQRRWLATRNATELVSNAASTTRTWGIAVCPPPNPSRTREDSEGNDGKGNDGAAVAGVLENGSAREAQAAPNPVAAGDLLKLYYTRSANAPLGIVVTDINGEVVHRALEEGNRTPDAPILLRTDGWAPGAYLISLKDGEVTHVVKVIVEP